MGTLLSETCGRAALWRARRRAAEGRQATGRQRQGRTMGRVSKRKGAGRESALTLGRTAIRKSWP